MGTRRSKCGALRKLMVTSVVVAAPLSWVSQASAGIRPACYTVDVPRYTPSVGAPGFLTKGTIEGHDLQIQSPDGTVQPFTVSPWMAGYDLLSVGSPLEQGTYTWSYTVIEYAGACERSGVSPGTNTQSVEVTEQAALQDLQLGPAPLMSAEFQECSADPVGEVWHFEIQVEEVWQELEGTKLVWQLLGDTPERNVLSASVQDWEANQETMFLTFVRRCPSPTVGAVSVGLMHIPSVDYVELRGAELPPCSEECLPSSVAGAASAPSSVNTGGSPALGNGSAGGESVLPESATDSREQAAQDAGMVPNSENVDVAPENVDAAPVNVDAAPVNTEAISPQGSEATQESVPPIESEQSNAAENSHVHPSDGCSCGLIGNTGNPAYLSAWLLSLSAALGLGRRLRRAKG